MKLRNILIYSLLGFCAAEFTANAQLVLGDKKSQKVDLGYGVESSEFLTTAASYTITAEELSRTSAISLADALYGKLPGLTALQNTGFKGEEGRGASFNIRGIQTTGETDILILVDGLERPIDRLTVEEVESVTVLKDAAAVALYGHEGINGVLLVKTKRGVADSGLHVKAGASHKLQFDPQMAAMVDAYDYASALNIARMNDGNPVAYSNAELQKFQDGSDPYVYPNVNWKDEVFKNDAHETNAFVSMYGGSDKVEYYTILDYTDARGLYKYPDQGDWNSQLKYSKASIRTNVDFQVTQSTRVKTDLYAIFMETNGVPNVNSNDAWWHLYKVPALAFPIKTMGLTPANEVWGGSQAYGDFNLVAKARGTGFTKTHQRQIWADITLEQDLDFITEGLKFYVGGSYDNASNIIENRTKGYQYGWNYYDGAGTMQEAVMGTVEKKLQFGYWVDSQWRVGTVNAGLRYAAVLPNGDNFSANAGYNMKSEVRDGRDNTWYRANWNLAMHYDHADRFVADLILAMNGSNRSYPAKWAFSPTLGLGWIYANNPTGFLSYGKMRFSAGVQHTDYVPAPGLWLAAWDRSHGQFWYGSDFHSSAGAFITQFPTTNFQQETAHKFNFGTDIRLGDCLDFSADAFWQQRSHILVSAGSLNSEVVGLQSGYDDKGRVVNYGVEASLRFAKAFSNGFSLSFGGNASFVKSKVIEWIENPAYPNLSVIDTPADAARGLVALGFFQSQAEIESSPLQQFGQVKVGDIKYKDVNGDNLVNENDVVAMDWGSAVPALNYGFNLGLEFKGFGINAYFQGAALQTKNLLWVDGVWGALSDNRNLSREYYDNCYDIAGAAALYPRLSTERVANNNRESTIWFREINWLKLRDCEVYYRLPAKLLSHVKIADAKIFVQGQNLLSIGNIAALDAENLNTGYPVMKAVNFGLSLVF
ncbi:MAG: SusC/RagA family TonB-linked outer membrane protein [Bacteroidales bacterium]|nr:SusC/RagA family TonB-linked outer membrane protein [Bacteroidales bacterium]